MSKLALAKVKAAVEKGGSVRQAAVILNVHPNTITACLRENGYAVVTKATIAQIRYEIAPETVKQGGE